MSYEEEAFIDFYLQRLTSAVNTMISDSEVEKILIESLAFENSNSKCKRVIRSLKARLASIDEYIRKTSDLVSHAYDAGLIVIFRNF